MSGDLACTYAALILSDDGQEVTADKMDSVIKAAGVEDGGAQRSGRRDAAARYRHAAGE